MGRSLNYKLSEIINQIILKFINLVTNPLCGYTTAFFSPTGYFSSVWWKILYAFRCFCMRSMLLYIFRLRLGQIEERRIKYGLMMLSLLKSQDLYSVNICALRQ